MKAAATHLELPQVASQHVCNHGLAALQQLLALLAQLIDHGGGIWGLRHRALLSEPSAGFEPLQRVFVSILLRKCGEKARNECVSRGALGPCFFRKVSVTSIVGRFDRRQTGGQNFSSSQSRPQASLARTGPSHCGVAFKLYHLVLTMLHRQGDLPAKSASVCAASTAGLGSKHVPRPFRNSQAHIEPP